MNEIFRSSELDPRTLASCCLLSHKYLKGARKWLYNHIIISLTYKAISGTGGFRQLCQYSQSAASLLSTLRANIPLRILVRSFDVQGGRKSSKIRTELEDALATFFSLAPQLRSLDLTYGLASSDKLFRQLEPECFSHLSNVKVGTLTKLGSTFLSQLHHLQRLDIEQVGSIVGISQLATRKLVSLRISELPNRFNLLPFLSPIASGLQDLALPFVNLLPLKLSDFIELRRLQVLSDDSNLEGDTDLWVRLDRCRKLSTLAFECAQVSREIDDKIFGWNGGLESHWPSSVRRIEFVNSISLDRLRTLLAIEKGLAEVAVVPSYLREMEEDIISFMCEKAGVELIFTS